MDNNVPRHVGVPCMVWPAMSSDLNPREDVLDHDLAEQHMALVEEWYIAELNSTRRKSADGECE
uniref:Uncharacterized protein n=1 Tax=Oryzias latipes TaxID=8090 RepID=A0A3P9KBP0_ORYLA